MHSRHTFPTKGLCNLRLKNVLRLHDYVICEVKKNVKLIVQLKFAYYATKKSPEGLLSY